MKYLPFDKLVLRTSLNRSELMRRLSENTEDSGKFFKMFSQNDKPFIGTVESNGFHIWRVIRYRNSFLPRIIGQIHETMYGSEIHIKFRLSLFVLVFMSIWMGVISLFCLGLIYYFITGGELALPLLIPFGMMLFGYLLTTLPFKYEVKKAKELLMNLTEASEKITH